jgi:transposase
LAIKRKTVKEDLRRRLGIVRPRVGFDKSGGVVCKGCFDKKLEIDRLREENGQLKQKLKFDTEKSGQLPVGPHTPSSRKDIKENSKEDLRKKKGGSKVGHPGHGRISATQETADEIIMSDCDLENCPDCGGDLHSLGSRERSIVEAMPIKAKQVLYKINRYRCTKCSKVVEKKPDILPKCLYGSRLLSQAAVMHYFHGITIGKLIDMFGPNVTEGGLIQAFHRLGSYCERAIPLAIEEFRKDPVRHADETGWRNDGHSGYAWFFGTERISILEFANTRAASIPRKIFGTEKLPGTLVVDRYGAYNKMPVCLQYCYAHLLREVEKLEEEFAENKEVIQFCSLLIPLLTQAMKLRGLDITNKEYYLRAKLVKTEMKKLMRLNCSHLGIIRIQQIFTLKEKRMYRWVKDRRVPADNNRAEREIRPTVIARKVSFGSQSEAGAKTRGSIMTVLFTAKKRIKSGLALEDWLKETIDRIAHDPLLNIYNLLPPG